LLDPMIMAQSSPHDSKSVIDPIETGLTPSPARRERSRSSNQASRSTSREVAQACHMVSQPVFSWSLSRDAPWAYFLDPNIGD